MRCLSPRRSGGWPTLVQTPSSADNCHLNPIGIWHRKQGDWLTACLPTAVGQDHASSLKVPLRKQLFLFPIHFYPGCLLCGPSVLSDTTGKWNGVHTKKFITCKFGYDSGPLIAFAYQVFMFVERGNKKNGPAGSSQCQVYLLRDVVINVPLSRLSVNRIILLVRENFSLTYQQNWAEREKPVDFR